MAVLAFVCMKYPETELSLIFLPGYGFSAETVIIMVLIFWENIYIYKGFILYLQAIKCLIGLDITGCVLRWRFFDHAAHLGGAVFGM